jgi:hypothetical protein
VGREMSEKAQGGSKYLDNRLFKLRTVFIFEILVSRSSKLDPTLIGFMKLFFGTCQTITLVVLMVYLLLRDGAVIAAARAKLYLMLRVELYLLLE